MSEKTATTFGDEFSFFASSVTPRIIAPTLFIAAAIRTYLGGWTWWDLVIVVGLIAAEPFIEWLIHVFILHWKPKRLFGREMDPLVARKHRAHHSDPRRTEWIFVPLPVLAKAMPLTGLAYLLIFPTLRLGMTAITAATSILLTYEWTHFLIHSRYKPKTRLYRYIWNAHRLHHFKNEHYWFGVTNPLGDHALGTFPEKDAVETSATCKTLGAA